MAKTREELERIARVLAGKLAQAGIVVERIVLYGSYANGQPDDHSDIDLAIISESFGGMGILERQEKLAGIVYQVSALIEPLGYTPAQFENCDPGMFAWEIKRSGRALYTAA